MSSIDIIEKTEKFNELVLRIKEFDDESRDYLSIEELRYYEKLQREVFDLGADITILMKDINDEDRMLLKMKYDDADK